MAEAGGSITHSKYFIDEFDSAVFDGPLRVYFAKCQEAEGLKVYYRLQEAMGLRIYGSPRTGQNFFVMIYPTATHFQERIGKQAHDSYFFTVPFGNDWVLGVDLSRLDERYESLCLEIPSALSDLISPSIVEASY